VRAGLELAEQAMERQPRSTCWTRSVRPSRMGWRLRSWMGRSPWRPMSVTRRSTASWPPPRMASAPELPRGGNWGAPWLAAAPALLDGCRPAWLPKASV